MKNRFTIALAVLFTICFTNLAHADMFDPIGAPKSLRATESLSIPGVDADTLLGETTQILGYLGPKAGPLLDKHGTTTYLAATIVTYEPWGLSLNAGTTNLTPDGFAGTLNWNFGQYLPVANVPILNHISTGTIGGGWDYRHIADHNGDPVTWNDSWAVTAQLKGTF